MLGASRETILHQMSTDGFSPRDSGSEIDLASRSPYFHGAERVCNRLKKREWLLAAYRKLGRLHPQSGEIERRHRLPRGEFLEHYYCLNRPVIITGMLDDWPALRRWSLDDFAERFGDREVDVQIGRSASPTYEAEREKHRRKMIFAEFIESVRGSGVTNDLYITANNTAANRDRPSRVVGGDRPDPRIPRSDCAARWLLLVRSRRHDHALPSRPDQQPHGR